MGNTYEVTAWVLIKGDKYYKNVNAYRGESLIAAVIAMWKAKKTSGCVTLKWR